MPSRQRVSRRTAADVSTPHRGNGDGQRHDSSSFSEIDLAKLPLLSAEHAATASAPPERSPVAFGSLRAFHYAREDPLHGSNGRDSSKTPLVASVRGKMPEIGSALGKAMRDFKKALEGVEDDRTKIETQPEPPAQS